jgi:hypothetical protein
VPCCGCEIQLFTKIAGICISKNPMTHCPEKFCMYIGKPIRLADGKCENCKKKDICPTLTGHGSASEELQRIEATSTGSYERMMDTTNIVEMESQYVSGDVQPYDSPPLFVDAFDDSADNLRSYETKIRNKLRSGKRDVDSGPSSDYPLDSTKRLSRQAMLMQTASSGGPSRRVTKPKQVWTPEDSMEDRQR